MFACAHPALDAGIRAPLILQVVLGLDASMIASAFLMSPATMGQRLVRAKDKIRQAGIHSEFRARGVTRQARSRIGCHLRRFAEGWADPGGTDPARRDLAEEALFLGRLVTRCCRTNRKRWVSLRSCCMRKPAGAHAATRRASYVPLAEQDPALWDSQMINLAEALLLRASTLGSMRPL